MSQTSQSLNTASAKKRIFRALLAIASAVLLIRIMGMLNQLVVTARFGAGARMDAYLVAYTFPYQLAILITSAVEYSIIPVYARVRSRGDQEQTSLLFSTLLNLLLIGAALLTVVMFIFRRQMVFFSAPGLDPLRSGLAIDLTSFILPVFLLMVVAGFLEYVLNAEGQFGWPAYAGLLVPLTTAVLVFICGKSYGVVMLCVGMIVGLLLQICIFILRAKRANIRYKPVLNISAPEIGLILTAALPALLGSVITQTSPIVDQIFASSLSVGSISALNYALKFISIVSSVIFGAAGQALLPHLSRQAAVNDIDGFKEILHLYLWVVAIGTTLLAVLLFVLAHPLVQVFFQRGAFTSENTNQTAGALMGFTIGLTPMALGFILSRAFGALRKNSITLYVAIFSVLANAIFDYVFARIWQGVGIALATSAVYFCTMFILIFTLRLKIGKLHLLTPPREVRMGIQKGIDWISQRRFYQLWQTRRPRFFPPTNIFYNLRQHLLRTIVVLSVFAVGIVGVFLNTFYTLRIAIGSIVMLLLLRYRYALLIVWVLYVAVVRSNPFLSGNNILTGLVAPTLLVMLAMPIKRTFKRLPALALLLLFILWMSTSLYISPIGVGAALTNWLIYLTYVALGVLAINILTTQRRILLIIDIMLLSGAFIGFYSIYSYITRQNGVPDPTVGFRVFAVFNSAPSLALFLSLVIPLAFYRALSTHGLKRFSCALLIPILLTALALTFTRGALISVPLSIIVIILLQPSRKRRIRLLGGTVGLVALVVLAALVSNVPIFSRFFGEDIASLNGRTYIWQAILSHFDPTQLTGKGINASVSLLTDLQVSASNQGVIATAPHSLLLGTLYDHGIIGATTLALVFIVLFVNLITGMLQASGERRMLFVIALAVFINVFMQSLDSSDLWIEDFSIYFWIIMSFPFAFYRDVPEPLDRTDQETLSVHEVLRSSVQTRSSV